MSERVSINGREMLQPEAVATVFDCSLATLRRLMKSGKIKLTPTRAFGRTWFDALEVAAALAASDESPE